MAEIFPNEGLDLIYGIVPKGATGPANTWVGLFTAYTASTVGTSAAVIASWSEVSVAGAYVRGTIALELVGHRRHHPVRPWLRSRPGDVRDRHRGVGHRQRVHHRVGCDGWRRHRLVWREL